MSYLDNKLEVMGKTSESDDSRRAGLEVMAGLVDDRWEIAVGPNHIAMKSR